MPTTANEVARNHASVRGGWPHDRWGEEFAVTTNTGDGHAKCTCGELSPELYSGRARRAWLKEHREEKVAQFAVSTRRELQDA